MWTTIVFEVILLSIVGLIGIIGNMLLIRMFTKIEVKLNFHLLMIVLAIYDTIYIVLCILVFSVPIVFEDFRKNGYHFYVVPKAIPIIQIALTGSVYCTVAISLERYLTVCHPFYLASKRWSAKRYILPIIIFSLLYNVSRFLEMRTKCSMSNVQDIQNSTICYKKEEMENAIVYLDEIEDENTQHIIIESDQNRTTMKDVTLDEKSDFGCKIELTNLRKNQYYYSIYIIGLNFVFNGLIPFLLIIIMNAMLYQKLKSVAHGRPIISQVLQFSTIHIELHIQQHSRNSTHQANASLRNKKKIRPSDLMLAKVSFFIVFVFVICHSIRWIPNIYELILRIQTKDVENHWPYWIESITQISHFLTVLNSSVNFYIFCAARYGISFCKRKSSSEEQEYFEMSRIAIDHVTVTNEVDSDETSQIRGSFL